MCINATKDKERFKGSKDKKKEGLSPPSLYLSKIVSTGF